MSRWARVWAALVLSVASSCGQESLPDDGESGQARPPSAPSGVTATVVSSSLIRVTWSDDATTETGYVVERSSSGGGYATAASLPKDSVSYDDTNVSSGVTYAYRVKATNGAGSSSYSSVATVTSGGGGGGSPPAAPSALASGSVTSNSVSLSWTDGSTDETAFTVESSSSSAGTYSEVLTLDTNVTTATVTGLTAGTTYYFRVRARNAYGSSAPTASVSVTTSSSGSGGLCTAGTTRCVGGNIFAVDVCNDGGSAWVRQSCPTMHACAHAQCRAACGLTASPAAPTACAVPIKDLTNDGTWIVSNDGRLASGTTVTAGIYKYSGGLATWKSDSLAWPYYWYLGNVDYLWLAFKLGAFSSPKSPRIRFHARRSGSFAGWEQHYFVDLDRGSTPVASCTLGPASSVYEVRECLFGAPYNGQLDYAGGWNYAYVTIGNLADASKSDSIELNWVALSVE